MNSDECSDLLLACSLDDEPIRLGVVADIHLAPPGAPPDRWHNEYDFDGIRERLHRACELLGSSASQLLVLGDVTHVGDQSSADEVAQILNPKNDVAVWAVGGNHDAQVSLGWGDRPPPGRLRIARQPGDGSMDILVTHYPAVSLELETARAGLLYAGDSQQALTRGAAIASSGRPTLVLAGHLHVRASTTRGGVLQLSVPALIEPPHEVALIELSGVAGELRVEVQHVQVGEPSAVERLPVLSAASQRWFFGGSEWRTD